MKTGEHIILDVSVTDRKNISNEADIDKFLYEVTKVAGMTLAVPPISLRFPVDEAVIENCKMSLEKNHLREFEKQVVLTTLSERAKTGNLGGFGVSGTAIWVESHCAVHTWEKEKFVTIDMFSCKNLDLKKMIDYVTDFFSVKDGRYIKLERFTDNEPKIIQGAL